VLKAEQDTVEFDFPDELPREAKAIAAVRVEVDDAEFRGLLQAQLDEVPEWKRGDRKHRKRLHRKLQSVYELYVLAAGNRTREAVIQRRCDSAGIADTKASHLTIRLVKLLLHPPEKSVYQYAAVLRSATLEQIPPDQLAEELAKRGNGIDPRADRFWARARKVDEGSESEPDSDDDGENDDEASDERNDATPQRPRVDWEAKLLMKFRKAEVGVDFAVVLTKVAEDRARIVRRTRRETP